MREVVRDVVAEVAPEELPLVRALSLVGHHTVVRRLRRRRSRREPLGFGLEEAGALVTTVLWLVLDEAVGGAVGAAVDRAGRRAARRLRTLLRRPDPDPVVPALTREQLNAVHAHAHRLSTEAGLPTERAVQVADSLVARLALDSPRELPPLQSPEG
ncbi:hypothetical protein [Streptosporangium sp. NPDC051022]|uniref:hypothetical protein n=1 Tax=Streptosporangium sp. NPDC051022 TaxID=3155752 RepID=UPI0034455966